MVIRDKRKDRPRIEGAPGDDPIVFRVAEPADVPAIARVRTSVRENLLTMEQLAERGITNESIAVSLATDRRGWVAIRGDEIIGFSMADRSDHSIFACSCCLVPRTRSSHHIAASAFANFGFKSGTRIISLLVSFRFRSSYRACRKC
jgi:hypothetical protein